MLKNVRNLGIEDKFGGYCTLNWPHVHKVRNVDQTTTTQRRD